MKINSIWVISATPANGIYYWITAPKWHEKLRVRLAKLLLSSIMKSEMLERERVEVSTRTAAA